MAMFRPFSTLTLLTLFSIAVISRQQPVLDLAEQESMYQVLESINSAFPWRSLFPDDLCISSPHGVVCDYFSESNSTVFETAHIVELNFGYVSDYNPNPPCSSNSKLNPLIFTSFKFLRKLFFYKCFNESRVSLPDVLPSFTSSLEELVFIENPSLVGPLSGILHNFSSLRRLVLTGNGVYGRIPDAIGDLVNLEEITLSRNQLGGEVTENLVKLQNLNVLDLSHNNLYGYVPEMLGKLTVLLKLDLSSNGFVGKIPESFKHMQSLEFLDLSFNRFGNFGIPLFLGEMPRLREVYLRGNLLGGQIPNIWENLGGVLTIGFSDIGLVGNIPSSMGLYLKNVCYLGLDNNKLEGTVPEELELLESVQEINLENNNLSGRVSFSTKFSSRIREKLKLAGNRDLCIDEKMRYAKSGGSLSLVQLKLCKKPNIPNAVFVNGCSLVPFDPHMLFMFLGFLFLFA
ncbi:Leucine-rich repeat receptor-like protein kinase family protein [Quillaja saponaria]|uniref:Leucine-rich repeat receptor-like protein kinase family protein n=1 Tax=Quillaja saponaria TaxID=32244 RepID=A0AAD7VE99_QUISA|nr:Leucine-rich repeat receptor-like protein kinase family protein [Quillaja saponaria]